MSLKDNYVYKKEIDWSLLQEGLTLPLDNQVVFAQNINGFLIRGESKNVSLILNGAVYDARVRNVNFDPKWNRKTDIIQIRYPKNGELSRALQNHFQRSYNYIRNKRDLRPAGDRSIIRLPEDSKEYLAMYTTEYIDTYILEPIFADEFTIYKNIVETLSEKVMEDDINYYAKDNSADVFTDVRAVKMRKLNQKISENLKLLYGDKCQICGKLIGEKYSSLVVEGHHIDYYTRSLNNNSDNILILCPNHHRIIHDRDPVFDYPNGLVEGLKINKHLIG